VKEAVEAAPLEAEKQEPRPPPANQSVPLRPASAPTPCSAAIFSRFGTIKVVPRPRELPDSCMPSPVCRYFVSFVSTDDAVYIIYYLYIHRSRLNLLRDARMYCPYSAILSMRLSPRHPAPPPRWMCLAGPPEALSRPPKVCVPPLWENICHLSGKIFIFTTHSGLRFDAFSNINMIIVISYFIII
jgi:hypothetical protein